MPELCCRYPSSIMYRRLILKRNFVQYRRVSAVDCYGPPGYLLHDRPVDRQHPLTFFLLSIMLRTVYGAYILVSRDN
jgi:hypothetical protein